MGKVSQTDNDWSDHDLPEADEFDPATAFDSATKLGPRGRLTWRLIEQAREERALREELVDFNDYV